MKLDEDTVRRVRERQGLTLAMVAARAGTSKNTVLSAEHGGDIRPTTARKIAEALGVEITDLLGETEHPLAQAPPDQPSFENHLRTEERHTGAEAVSSGRPRSLAEGQLHYSGSLKDLSEEQVREILEGVRDGRVTVEEAARRLVAARAG